MLTAIEFPNPYIFFLEVREDKLLSPAELHRFHSMRMTANWIDEHCAIFPYIVQLRHAYFHIQTAEAVKYCPLYLLRLNDCALDVFKILGVCFYVGAVNYSKLKNWWDWTIRIGFKTENGETFFTSERNIALV